jgi:signal transduction histidine kinase
MQQDISLRRVAIKRFCGFALIVSSIFTLLIITVAFIVEDEVIAQLLHLEVEHAQSHHSKYNRLPKPLLPFVTYYSTHEDLQASLPPNTNEVFSEGEIFVDGPLHYHIKKFSLNLSAKNVKNNQAYLLAQVGSILAVSQLSSDIMALVIVVSIVGITLAIFQAYKLANLTVSPLEKLAEHVKLMNDKQFGASEVVKTNKELEYVSNTINLAFKNLQEALLRESAFTRDVSHELRTPLTVFQNALSLIDQRGWKPSDYDDLLPASKNMQFTVDTLLLLARKQSVKSENILLRPLIEQTILDTLNQLELSNVTANISVDDGQIVYANSDILCLILKSCIDNVIKHAAPCSVWFSFDKGELVVQNTLFDSPPFDNASTHAINKTSVKVMERRTPSTGLGNVMTKRLAKRMNWTITFESSHKYYRTTLVRSMLN